MARTWDLYSGEYLYMKWQFVSHNLGMTLSKQLAYFLGKHIPLSFQVQLHYMGLNFHLYCPDHKL